jgi:hypothetical protein
MLDSMRVIACVMTGVSMSMDISSSPTNGLSKIHQHLGPDTGKSIKSVYKSMFSSTVFQRQRITMITLIKRLCVQSKAERTEFEIPIKRIL